MQENFYEHFYSDGHNGFPEDVAIPLIDKTDGKNPKNKGNYWMRTLKTLAPDGFNIEDCLTKYCLNHILQYIKVFSY